MSSRPTGPVHRNGWAGGLASTNHCDEPQNDCYISTIVSEPTKPSGQCGTSADYAIKRIQRDSEDTELPEDRRAFLAGLLVAVINRKTDVTTSPPFLSPLTRLCKRLSSGEVPM